MSKGIMRSLVMACTGALLLAGSWANAAEVGDSRGAGGFSFGYVLITDPDGPTFPLGGYVTGFIPVAAGGVVGLKLDLSYGHQGSERIYRSNYTDAVVGVAAHFKSTGSALPFLHALGGACVSWDLDSSAGTKCVGVGGGVDLRAGSSTLVRLGADYRHQFESTSRFGGNTLHLRLGLAF